MIARVYAAISAITAAFALRGIAKERINLDDDYAYRSIDDVLDRLAPLLASHKLCVLPRVLEREASERTDPEGAVLTHVAIRAAFDLVSAEDGSSHTIEAYGEALDHSDKATAKAMTSAYKAAVLQAFCVPVWGSEDSDQRSPRLKRDSHVAAPVEGWAQWAEDLTSVIATCMSEEAIERLLGSNKPQLHALACEQPDLYAHVGEGMAARRAALTASTAMAKTPGSSGERCPSSAAQPGLKPTGGRKPPRKVLQSGATAAKRHMPGVDEATAAARG
jgi:hypothetical protein